MTAPPSRTAQRRCCEAQAARPLCAGVTQSQNEAVDETCCAAVLDDITDALAKLGIEVEQVHKESAGGQFEIVTEHEEVLKVRAVCCGAAALAGSRRPPGRLARLAGVGMTPTC